MKIEERKISELIPYEFNNRVHTEKQIDRIANSIKEFGFNQPIVIDESNIILVGHGRLLAASKLGLEVAPVLCVKGLSETKKRAYRILDNKLAGDSTWDFDNLGLELGNLEDEGFDLGEWGLDDLLELTQPEEAASDDDFKPSDSREALIKRGDLIKLGNHRLVCGDSSSAEDFSTLKADKIDLILTDPPYGVAYKGKTSEALEIEGDDLDEAALERLWSGAVDVWSASLKAGGAIYATVPAGPLNLIFALVLKERGILRQQLVWNKNCIVMGRSDYHYKHEPILYGWKPGAAHYFTEDRTKASVLDFDKPNANREHPTMKPVTLWGELISNSSKKGEVVGDPFLGSGTTLIAAEQTGRCCVGMEIDPSYCEVIIDRYRQACEKSGKSFNCQVNGQDLTDYYSRAKLADRAA